MTMFFRRALACLFVGGIGFPLHAIAQPRGPARVLDIQATTGVTRVVSTPGVPSTGARMTKFIEDGVDVPAAILAVRWELSPALAPPGLELQFDYRMDGKPEIRTRVEPLPPRTRGPATTLFKVPLTGHAGWRVSAWRLRLQVGGIVLEEYKSAAWR
ncbi:MAG TPA: hypothetical protein PKE12_02975 [Kiritimatiellia bacterium]|nr:hypothetical protein [Kiritimatiellia bacterium]